MATTFGGSRLANLREKRTSGDQNTFKKEQAPRLNLADQTEEISYQPSSSGSNFMSRTQNRLLKGRIERSGPEKEESTGHKENSYEPNVSSSSRPKLTLSNSGQTEQLKLVLNDDPPKEERRVSGEQSALKTTQKRILIAKEPEKEKEPEKPVEPVITQPLRQTQQVQPEKPIFNEEKPIQEEDVEQSMPGESDLVECPEGCGRKFNRKALEKHAKACKLVFMSKRKQFNSEAKRLTNKEQAAILKQQKEKQKKDKLKGTKGFEKTSDNWKSASQDFRAAVKAIKKQAVDEDQEVNDEEKEEMKILNCKYCEKPFAQVFLEKHFEVCAKRKESEKKKTLKKK